MCCMIQRIHLWIFLAILEDDADKWLNAKLKISQAPRDPKRHQTNLVICEGQIETALLCKRRPEVPYLAMAFVGCSSDIVDWHGRRTYLRSTDDLGTCAQLMYSAHGQEWLSTSVIDLQLEQELQHFLVSVNARYWNWKEKWVNMRSEAIPLLPRFRTLRLLSASWLFHSERGFSTGNGCIDSPSFMHSCVGKVLVDKPGYYPNLLVLPFTSPSLHSFYFLQKFWLSKNCFSSSVHCEYCFPAMVQYNILRVLQIALLYNSQSHRLVLKPNWLLSATTLHLSIDESISLWPNSEYAEHGIAGSPSKHYVGNGYITSWSSVSVPE